MSYIFKNYKCFVKNNIFLFIISVTIIFISTVLIHFVYGVYQNYHIVQEGNYSSVSDQDEFSVTFSGNREVTKADLDRCIEKISDQMDIMEASGNSDSILLTLQTPLDWNYPDPMDIEVKILVDRYGIKAPDIVFDNMQTYGFSDGGRWTDVQEKEGAKVALFWDFNNPIYNGVDITNPTVALNKDNTVTIDNKKYEIIGYQNYCYAPIIPYSSLDVSATFTKCTFTFFEHISMTSYETLNRILKEELGDNFAINRTSSPRKNNVHYIYGVVFLIVGFVAFIAIVDLMLLYRYYLRKVKYKAVIFRLCGMPLTKSICLQIGEFLLLSLPIYICAAIFFSSILLPRLRPYYVYMPNAFNVSVYGILFGIYIIFSLTFCLVITWYENHKSIVNMLL